MIIFGHSHARRASSERNIHHSRSIFDWLTSRSHTPALAEANRGTSTSKEEL